MKVSSHAIYNSKQLLGEGLVYICRVNKLAKRHKNHAKPRKNSTTKHNRIDDEQRIYFSREDVIQIKQLG